MPANNSGEKLLLCTSLLRELQMSATSLLLVQFPLAKSDDWVSTIEQVVLQRAPQSPAAPAANIGLNLNVSTNNHNVQFVVV